MAVLTRKFSEFLAANANAANKYVGLSGGANAIFDVPISWTIAGRPSTPVNGQLGYNTELQQYEYYDAILVAWVQLEDSGDFSTILALLASHTAGEGASLIGLENQGSVSNKTVQDLSEAKFIVQANNGTLLNAQGLDVLPSGFLSSTTGTGVVSSRTHTGTANQINVANGDGAADPVYSLSNTLDLPGTMTIQGSTVLDEIIDDDSMASATDTNISTSEAIVAYITAQTTGMFLPLVGGTMSGIINMNNHKITNLTDPSSGQDAVTLSFLGTALGDYLPLSGGTMSGVINMNSHKITNLTDCTNPQDAATKFYVDSVAAGLTIQPAVAVATTATLNALYVNGASGIGATLTNNGALAALVIDGYSVNTNDRVLVKDQSSTLQNGIYTVTNVGSGAVAWILTRATDYDQPSEIQPGDLVIVNNGTLYAGTSFIETASVAAVGTDPILFSQFTFSATAVLLKANNLSDVANTVTSFNNISPLTTKGDLLTYNSGNVRLAVGMTDGQVLQVSSGAPTGLAYSTATYPVTTTVNQILYSSATNVIGGISTVNGGVLVTDNTGLPSMLANPAAAGRMLQSANAAIAAWSTPTYPSTSGSAGKIIISDGTNNVYSTPTFPNTAPGAGKLLFGDGTNWIVSTPTYPNASATIRKIIVSDGTNFVASTETYATPGSSGNVMTSDGTNWTSAAPASTSFTWSTVTGTSQTAAVDNGYFANNAGLVTVTLPATAAVGKVVEVAGQGAGGWKLLANTGQTIQFGNLASTTAGSFSSTNQYDTIKVVCQVANTTWQVLSAVSSGLTKA